MRNPLPLISSRPELSLLCSQQLNDTSYEILPLTDIDTAMEHLRIEMPALFILDFSAPGLRASDILLQITQDPWLLHGGMIAIHADHQAQQELNQIQGSNLIIALLDADLPSHLARVIQIIEHNRRLTFQRGLGEDMVGGFSASYELDNNLTEARCFANLICNFMFNTGRLDLVGKRQLHMVLNEMLTNAIEHGNCGIDFETKKAWLDQGRPIDLLIRERAQTAANRNKRVRFDYTLGPDRAAFQICDEGRGFDWKSQQASDPLADLLALHGRGILMTRNATDKFEYNEAGNEVRFSIPYRIDPDGIRPALFRSQPVRQVQAGEEIFCQGEPGDHLYYIARGRYQVWIDGQQLSHLCEDDIFIGEMSFLLNQQRSATVIAECPGHLICISRKDFVQAIRANPSYALFLARLLAQRLERANRRPC